PALEIRKSRLSIYDRSIADCGIAEFGIAPGVPSKRDLETLLAVYVLEGRHKQADVKYSVFAFPEWKSYGSIRRLEEHPRG
ncbi:MAG: hypothetical protein WBX10_14200, partial [Candidatus Sulfotelmatobacter sp.]